MKSSAPLWTDSSFRFPILPRQRNFREASSPSDKLEEKECSSAKKGSMAPGPTPPPGPRRGAGRAERLPEPRPRLPGAARAAVFAERVLGRPESTGRPGPARPNPALAPAPAPPRWRSAGPDPRPRAGLVRKSRDGGGFPPARHKMAVAEGVRLRPAPAFSSGWADVRNCAVFGSPRRRTGLLCDAGYRTRVGAELGAAGLRLRGEQGRVPAPQPWPSPE